MILLAGDDRLEDPRFNESVRHTFQPRKPSEVAFDTGSNDAERSSIMGLGEEDETNLLWIEEELERMQ
jgi:hypothetical protein